MKIQNLSKLVLAAIILLVILFFVLRTASIDSTNLRIASTTQYLLVNPSPTPNFVSQITRNSSNDKILCINIYQGALWEQNDDPDELQEHIVSNTHLFINESVIGTQNISLLGMFPRDSEGNITDKFNPNIDFCYDLSEFSNGAYTAHVETSSLSGKVYEYYWAVTLNGE